jgi:hypothetical protein
MTADRTALDRLNVAADLYASACEERGRAMQVLKRAIRECDEAGIARLTIAQLAHVSRQTVYDALGEVRREVQP